MSPPFFIPIQIVGCGGLKVQALTHRSILFLFMIEYGSFRSVLGLFSPVMGRGVLVGVAVYMGVGGEV